MSLTFTSSGSGLYENVVQLKDVLPPVQNPLPLPRCSLGGL